MLLYPDLQLQGTENYLDLRNLTCLIHIYLIQFKDIFDS